MVHSQEIQSAIQTLWRILDQGIEPVNSKQIENCLAALEQIGERGAPFHAGYIVPDAFSDYEVIAKKARKIIRKLLTKIEVKTAWLNLYSHFSGSHDEYGGGYIGSFFNEGYIEKIAHFPPEEAVHLYGIVSLNRNGYFRENALNCLRNLPISENSEKLPYIILRLNDWVFQVRQKAQIILEEILPTISVKDLIKHYILIEWLDKTKRTQLVSLQEKIYQQMQNPAHREELFNAIQTGSLKERLFCFKVLAREVAKGDRLIDCAIVDRAPEIRQWAACHLPNTVDFRKRAAILFSDHVSHVRYAVLKNLPQESFEEYRIFYEVSIFDNAKTIREYARFMLSSHGDSNFLDKYKKKLFELYPSASGLNGRKSANIKNMGQLATDQPQELWHSLNRNFSIAEGDIRERASAGVLIGLAEVSTKDEIALIKSFVNHKLSEIRACALYTLHRLGAENIDEWYILGLQDSSAKVRNTCAFLLQSGYSHLTGALEKLLENGGVKTQKVVLKVLMNYGVLDSLRNILFALTQPSEDLQIVAWQFLTSWYHRHGRHLWFSFSNDTYKCVLQLLEKLRKVNIEPPCRYTRAIWDDLPHIMEVLSPKSP